MSSHFSEYLLPVNLLELNQIKMAAAVRGESGPSEYVQELDARTRSRYSQKLKLCDGNDPFCLLNKDLISGLSKYPASFLKSVISPARRSRFFLISYNSSS